MAFDDIRPFESQNGGHDTINHFRLGGAITNTVEDTSWERGYVLQIDPAVGDINPEIDGTVDPAEGFTYLAMASSANLIAAAKGVSGAASHDITVPCYAMGEGMSFRTRNAFNNNDTNVGPATGTGSGAMTGIFVGVTCDLWVDDTTTTMVGHDHGIDINGNFFTITRILDDQGRDTWASGGTADWIVFRANS